MLQYKHPIKDRSIKIFYEDKRKENNETLVAKVYIHPENKSIKAYVRQLSATEIYAAQASKNDSTIEFTINAREIKGDMFVEFREKTYQIEPPDNFDFSNTEIKFRGKEVNQKKYNQVLWEAL